MLNSRYHLGEFVKPAQTFRHDYTFTNSNEAIQRFPFPWVKDQFNYSVNVQAHPGGEAGSVYVHDFDIDEHYLSEVQERECAMEFPHAQFQAQPYMDLAQWDVLALSMHCLARDYPQYFQLKKNGNSWRWKNNILNIEQAFEFGVNQSLPLPPAEFMFRQMQGDFVMLDQRDHNLFVDAGLVTGPSHWSLPPVFAKSFVEMHAPVPSNNDPTMFNRALAFLLNMNTPARRTNWSLTVNPRLDLAPETAHLWGDEIDEVNENNVGDKIHLRVELQTFHRLARSHCILFGVRTYLCSLNELASRDALLLTRLYKVLSSLPKEIVEYKSLDFHCSGLFKWLENNMYIAKD